MVTGKDIDSSYGGLILGNDPNIAESLLKVSLIKEIAIDELSKKYQMITIHYVSKPIIR